MKAVGTISIGVKAPIIRAGDDLIKIVVDSVMSATEEIGFQISDRDIVAVTEAVVGKAQRNFATIDQIAADIRQKFGDKKVGLVFPITSRNRFLQVLKAISKGVKELVIQLSLPSDEVGNHLIDPEKLLKSNLNPHTSVITAEEFYREFGDSKHEFTGIDYIDLYSKAGDNCTVILSNNPNAILKYTDYVINADIHSRKRTKRILLSSGAKQVVSLDEILTKSVDGSGYHPEYGVLGTNVSTDDTVKLLPRDADNFAKDLQKAFKKATGKNVECIVYGDGAFKDPVGGIWELADPVVSLGHTEGLMGTPREIKLKYVSDNKVGNLCGEEAKAAVVDFIKNKKNNSDSQNLSLGTTPRRYTDLIGSLSDLTSGSGDKGTPIVLIKNYFDTYAD